MKFRYWINVIFQFNSKEKPQQFSIKQLPIWIAVPQALSGKLFSEGYIATSNIYIYIIQLIQENIKSLLA